MKFDNETEIPFAIETLSNGEKELVKLNVNSDTIVGQNDRSPVDYIIYELSKDIPSFKNDFLKYSSGKKMMYLDLAESMKTKS